MHCDETKETIISYVFRWHKNLTPLFFTAVIRVLSHYMSGNARRIVMTQRCRAARTGLASLIVLRQSDRLSAPTDGRCWQNVMSSEADDDSRDIAAWSHVRLRAGRLRLYGCEGYDYDVFNCSIDYTIWFVFILYYIYFLCYYIYVWQGGDYWVTVHSLKSLDGGILDQDDRLVDIVDDREQVLCVYLETFCWQKLTNIHTTISLYVFLTN